MKIRSHPRNIPYERKKHRDTIKNFRTARAAHKMCETFYEFEYLIAYQHVYYPICKYGIFYDWKTLINNELTFEIRSCKFYSSLKAFNMLFMMQCLSFILVYIYKTFQRRKKWNGLWNLIKINTMITIKLGDGLYDMVHR